MPLPNDLYNAADRKFILDLTKLADVHATDSEVTVSAHDPRENSSAINFIDSAITGAQLPKGWNIKFVGAYNNRAFIIFKVTHAEGE